MTNGYESSFQKRQKRQVNNEAVNAKGFNTLISKTYDTYEFPFNLGQEGSKYPHFMIFYINANDKAKISRAPTSKSYDIDTTKSSQQATGATINANASSGGNIKTQLGKIGVTDNDVFIIPKKRLTTAICLPMPKTIKPRYGATYTQAESGGALGTAMTGLASGQELSKVGVNFAKDIVQGGITSLIGTIAEKAGVTNKANFENLVNKARGAQKNQRLEHVFEKMEFSSFEFDYHLVPRNTEENKMIKTIIDLFKSAMHPELNDTVGARTGTYLMMPAEFDIEYRFGEFENEYINKIPTCVLKTVEVNYTPMDEWIAYSGTDEPTGVRLQLQFASTEPLLRHMIEKGY